MGSLFVVYAHPDDEIGNSGAMMKAKADGHRVVLVTATRGEVGEIHNMDEATARPRLAEIREGELRTAGEIIGVDRQEFLGYRDSGMVDTPDNKDPRSFQQARIDEAAGKLAVILREERPDVVVTFGDDGIYGHPDHIKAHHVTNAALDVLDHEGSQVKKLYYMAIPRSLIQGFAEQFPDQVQEQAGRNMRVAGTPDELVTTRVDVHEYVARKRQASDAHVSQNDPDSWFAKLPEAVYQAAFGTEYYQLARGKPGSSLPESDLFAGIDT
jgi:N-acetyl-1-D-myo-inositol-2-amino-2-deoxy-alpha-D-glucopyranoside deacetylase